MSSQLFEVHSHLVPGQHIREYPGATRKSQEDVVQLHVKQYTPIRATAPSRDAVTIIGTHANGFPKELYEPLWDEILSRSNGRFEIRAIWIADVAHQGQSYVHNEDVLSNDPSWFDHSRDLLYMINHFRSQMPRPIVGIGHSFGGTQIVNLSLMHPRLLTALVLLDPVLELGPTTGGGSEDATVGNFGIAAASTHRRDLWPSREEAAKSFKKSPFYQGWDKRVLDAWLVHGLRELPTSLYPEGPFKDDSSRQVTLKTTKHQEVWTYLRPNYGGQDEKGQEVYDPTAAPDIIVGSPYNYPFYRPESAITFHKLPFVRPAVLYILGELSNLSSPDCQRDKVKVTGTGVGGNGGIAADMVQDTILPGIGHLVPFEATNATAQIAVDFLSRRLAAWRDEEAKWKSWLAAKPQKDHTQVNEEWLQRVGPLTRKSKGPQNTKL